ncbi:hypothetical protein L3081_13855 [Colwellia sp. MSW7]|uniref:STAS domain-containing protein n=1 Tax=Colwellia maritima TaxID=2912588 RepID=A0ABS9X201_9GAMM|nr:hypothetical protein [Colwellia maritima]MCI2284270.1 hypothetical protein [Colwellia maritima]
MSSQLISIDEVNARQSIIGISLLAKLVQQEGGNVKLLLDNADTITTIE